MNQLENRMPRRSFGEFRSPVRVPSRIPTRKEPLHEPTHPRPLPGGERAFVRAVSVSLPGGVRGGFMVPMHGIKVVGALHEPERGCARSTSRSTQEAFDALRLGPTKRGPPRPERRSAFMAPMRGQEIVEATNEAGRAAVLRRPFPASRALLSTRRANSFCALCGRPNHRFQEHPVGLPHFFASSMASNKLSRLFNGAPLLGGGLSTWRR